MSRYFGHTLILWCIPQEILKFGPIPPLASGALAAILLLARQPALPRHLSGPGSEGIAEPHERQLEEPVVGQQPLRDLDVAQAHIAQTQVLVLAPLSVEQRGRA